MTGASVNFKSVKSAGHAVSHASREVAPTYLLPTDKSMGTVVLLDDKGKVVRSWGQEGHQPGEFQLPHMLAADADGNLYVGEIKGERFQKLIRK